MLPVIRCAQSPMNALLNDASSWEHFIAFSALLLCIQAFFFFFKFLAEADFCAFPPLLRNVELLPRVEWMGEAAVQVTENVFCISIDFSSPSFLGQSVLHQEVCSPSLPTPKHNCIFLNQFVIMEALLKEPRCCHPFMLYWGGLRHFLCAVSASKLLIEAWELISILRDFNNSS